MIVIVNPHRSAGVAYAYIAKHYTKYPVIGLWTSPEKKELGMSSAPTDLIDRHIFEDELDQISPSCFIPADDDAFLLADQLQAKYFPHRANDPSLFDVRSNKLKTLEHLSNHGLVISQPRPFTDDTVIDRPSVLKPINGVANENIFFVNSSEAARQVAKHGQFLVQDEIRGPEYSVELVSAGDQHRCTTMSIYGGKYQVNGKWWRDDTELIEPIPEIIEYAKKIVSALGVRMGVTWCQIMVDDRGPHLIEVNYRPQGNGFLSVVSESVDSHYAGNAIRAYTTGALASTETYKKIGSSKKLNINNRRARIIDELDMSKINQLPSVRGAWANDERIPGFLEESSEFRNAMALVVVANKDTAQFDADMKVIERWRGEVEW